MRRRVPISVLVGFLWLVCAGAGTGEAPSFDASTLAPAFSGSQQSDNAAVAAALAPYLPPTMSVSSQGHIIVAAPGSRRDAALQARRMADYEAQMRQGSFPDLEPRPVVVALAESPSAYRRMAGMLYPGLSVSKIPSSGFYHPEDRLILATAADASRTVPPQLMLALLGDANPDAPYWFGQAVATLYESSDWHGDRLVPLPDQRMRHISPDEDLSYDVFAGICDCSPVSAEQLALMRLLLIFLDERNELAALHAAVKQQGRYTTLLQALEAMEFDRDAWKNFAQRSVRAYPR